MSNARMFLAAVSAAVSIVLTAALGVSPAAAQNFSSSGQGWSGSWGFSSPSDRSLQLQQAQAIRQAETRPGPTTVVTNTTNSSTVNNLNTINDSRSHYIDGVGDMATATLEYQIGDNIGQKTYSVGALNTGETRIEVNGNDNSIIATNSATTEGCVDGSINFSSLSSPSEAPSGQIDISVTGTTQRDVNC